MSICGHYLIRGRGQFGYCCELKSEYALVRVHFVDLCFHTRAEEGFVALHSERPLEGRQCNGFDGETLLGY